MDVETDYLTTGEAARYLGVSAQTVRRAVQRGLLNATPRGAHARYLLPRAEVEAYARGRAAAPRDAGRSMTMYEPHPRGVRTLSARLAALAARQARTEQALRESDAAFRLLFASSPQPMWVYDTRSLRFLAVNDAAVNHYGYTCEEFLRLRITQIRPPTEIGAVREAVRERQNRALHRSGEWRHLLKDGRLIDVEITSHALTFAGRAAILVLAHDITERKRAEQALRYQALHDALTGLPNRTLLLDRLEQALLAARRVNGSVALLLLDLDRFKEVNNTFGHHHGDLLLQQVTERLCGLLRAGDTVARLGGDEFAVLLPGDDQKGAAVTASKIGAALDAPFVLGASSAHIGTSIGIAVSPTHGTEATTLLRRADVAMYVSKRRRHNHTLYAPEQDAALPERLALIAELREAVARDELVLYYQPKVSPAAGVRGVEALVRWRHPRRGLLSPDQFIPLAEETGLIASLTQWVLQAALRQCRAWQAKGLQVAINLSMSNLHDPSLPETIAQSLRAHGLPPASLRIEITEGTLMADAERAQDVLAALEQLGVGISVDDYGTGYSSLAYLKRLPVDELKIDMSFVRHMRDDEIDAAIVASTIGLGHSLGLSVVAEGVENQDAWETLVTLGCDAAQGYHLSRPLPADQLERWLAVAR